MLMHIHIRLNMAVMRVANGARRQLVVLQSRSFILLLSRVGLCSLRAITGDVPLAPSQLHTYCAHAFRQWLTSQARWGRLPVKVLLLIITALKGQARLEWFDWLFSLSRRFVAFRLLHYSYMTHCHRTGPAAQPLSSKTAGVVAWHARPGQLVLLMVIWGHGCEPWKQQQHPTGINSGTKGAALQVGSHMGRP
jgi:hypothetical protein